MTEQTSIQTRDRVESATIIKAREIASRIKYMIVNGNKLSDPEVFALAQYAAANDLNPFSGECYYLPGSGPVPGIAGWRKKAQEQLDYEAAAHKVTGSVGFWVETRPANPGECNYDPDKDIAVHVTLHDSISKSRWLGEWISVAGELKKLGEENYFEEAKIMVGPEPVWTGVGVVFEQEKFGATDKFDRYERAAKRGEKLALRKRFPRINLPQPEGVEIDDDVIDTTYAEANDRPKLTEAEIMGALGFHTTDRGEPEYKAAAQPRFTPAELRDKLNLRAAKLAGKAQPETMQALAATLEGVLGGVDQRHEFIRWLTDGNTDSLKDLGDGLLLALHEWLKPVYNRAAKVFECGSPEARVEATGAHTAYLKANGAQAELL